MGVLQGGGGGSSPGPATDGEEGGHGYIGVSETKATGRKQLTGRVRETETAPEMEAE